MSHGKERTEKICLNCNATLHGYYCHVCGQANREPRDSVWGIVSHFFYDITHFDGKFFTTLGTLIRKPGFLSLEFIRGRRARYLEPVRMYVFTSALFFLVFFTLFDVHNMTLSLKEPGKIEKGNLDKLKAAALANAETREDSLAIERGLAFIPKSALSVEVDSARDNNGPKVGFSIEPTRYNTVGQYDSAQRALPAAHRDGWIKSAFSRRLISLNSRYQEDRGQLLRDIMDKFLHSFSAILFVSLPLFALYLNLLYIRRKQYYYADHVIFLIHLYIFTFLFLLVYFALDSARTFFDLQFIGWIEGLFLLSGIFFAYKSMRNFYRQGRAKTILKFLLLNIMALATMILLFAIFFSITVFRV